jgi:hypothetical protein
MNSNKAAISMNCLLKLNVCGFLTGTMTLSRMTFSVMTLSITTSSIMLSVIHDECHVFYIILLSAAMLSVSMVVYFVSSF